MSACQVVLPQLEVGCLCRVAEVNTHGNCHRGLWLQPLWEWKRRRGEKEEWVTRAQCAGGGGMEQREREGDMEGGQQQSGTDKHPHHLCFHFTKQGHRVWEIYPSISFPLIPHTSSTGNKTKKKSHEGLAYFQNNRLVKESISIKRDEVREIDRAGETRARKRELSKATKAEPRAWTAAWERRSRGRLRMRGTDRQKHPPLFPSRPVFLSPWSRAISLYDSFHRQSREEQRLQRKPSANRAITN